VFCSGISFFYCNDETEYKIVQQNSLKGPFLCLGRNMVLSIRPYSANYLKCLLHVLKVDHYVLYFLCVPLETNVETVKSVVKSDLCLAQQFENHVLRF
jgi:hypothetical protein